MIFSLLIAALTSCSSVKFYSDEDLKSASGLRVYSARPYLLVERNTDKDKPAKTTVVMLPDLSRPQYLVVKPGIGSNELKLAIENGCLSSYGITTESDIPETINAIASLVAKGSEAAKDLNGTFKGEPVRPEIELYEISITKDSSVLKKVNVIYSNGIKPFAENQDRTR